MQQCVECKYASKALYCKTEGRLPGSGFRHRSYNDGGHSAPNLGVGRLLHSIQGVGGNDPKASSSASCTSAGMTERAVEWEAAE